MEEIAPDVYVEAGYWGVTVGAIVTGDGVICVDSPALPADARDWRARIADLTREPVCYVIYTDAHRDRILGSQYLGQVAAAHDIAGEALKGCGDAFCQQSADFFSRRAPQAAFDIVSNLRVILPQLTFSQQLTFHRGSMSIAVQHVGGATPCSAWVTIPDRAVVFAGDVVTLNTHPRLAEADLDRWIDLLRELTGRLPAARVVPGRGGVVARKTDLKKLGAYLRVLRTRVKALIRSGRPRSDTVALIPDLMPRFPTPKDEREHVQRRIKAGLDRVYDFYNSKGAAR